MRYKIGDIAKRLDVAVGTIRLYESRGMILVNRTESGQRWYDDSDYVRLREIQKCIKKSGLNIEGILRLMALLPCWEIHGCTENEIRNCRAIRQYNETCWMVRSHGCHNFDIQTCRECRVYQNATDCDHLKSLLYPKIKHAKEDASSCPL